MSVQQTPPHPRYKPWAAWTLVVVLVPSSVASAGFVYALYAALVTGRLTTLAKGFGATSRTVGFAENPIWFSLLLVLHAALGGGWLVVSASKQSLKPMPERAVISVFQGVSVFFYSGDKMAETCTEWLSHPKHSGYALSPKNEMELWRKVNPDIIPY